ncbi:ATP-dependent DNA helicase [Corynebacterium bouchesdurhonense]|uniref:ATP-dependent DNA helicase n=1 Tax=Corynebacterium bouchesdurhonense TaxID=1720192 RepID=UPI00082AE285|nr:ATP-dependent DNA helicase [Corynebacterium bouchesdurhonense]
MSDHEQPLSQTTEDLLAAAVGAIGGTTRPGQLKMAQAVTRAFERERHLAVQAGTGTGKSLAYLVPAILHAQRTKTTVVVSTATIALQRQLVERDLPRLADALEPLMERRPTFAILKGRNNYACLHKLSLPEDAPEALIEEDNLSRIGREVKRVAEWAQETETGDRDDLVPGVSDLVWRQVSVTSSECLGAARCPHGDECFAQLAREEASKVDVVVTNHALLAIDALSDVNILPEHSAVVIDEAHELEGRITSVATNVISARALTLAARRAGRIGGDKDVLEGVIEDVTLALAAEQPGRWETIAEPARAAFAALSAALRKTYDAIAEPRPGESENDPETFAERGNLKNHLADLAGAVDRILSVFDEEDVTKHRDVVWLTRSERDEDSVSVAPLSVSALLRTSLFDASPVVLTSATLTVGGNFDAMAAAWGLPAGKWDHLDVGTPFNPAKAGILYTAKHLPAPGREGLSPATLDEMAELITAAGGRTLALFSSRRAAEQAANEMRARLPFEVFLQGEDSTGALVDAFAKSENSCLFGTLTLWQGVDVPGSSLSLVIIDRIPFPRPDDPLLQARAAAADAAGRSGFMEVSATHAALLLAQGTGRLLRATGDRGVIAVLDNRLVTKRYGQFLRNSLLPFWTTTDPAVVRGALTRLVAK